MGEARRRKQLDPTYGQTKVLENAVRHLEDLVKSKKTIDNIREYGVISLFTNFDRGCTPDEIQLLKRELPKIPFDLDNNVSFRVLPKKFASVPVEKALNHFVSVDLGQ